MVDLRERTAMLNGHELSYLDTGDGPAVLFIHGLTGSHRTWAHLVDAMNTDHRVLAPTLCRQQIRPTSSGGGEPAE